MKYAALVIVLFFLSVSQLATAQISTSENDLESIIESMQSGNLDYSDMEIPLQVAIEEQESAVAGAMAQLGQLVSVKFRQTDQSTGVDVYIADFTNGRTVWQFARSPSTGKIAVLYFQAF